MSMSREHYRKVAEMFHVERKTWEGLEGEDTAKAVTFILANRLATMFQHDNPRFDRDKFLEACGIK